MKFVWSVMLMLVFSGLQAQVRPGINPLEGNEVVNEEIKALITKYTAEFSDSTQISIGILLNGKAHFYGIEKLNGENQIVENQDRIFEIGSITKVFTSTILANALVDNKVTLETPIHEILGYSLNKNLEIPIGQLSNHTSGLPRLTMGLMTNAFMNFDNPYKSFLEENMIDYLKNKIKLRQEPGEVCEYSNIGVGVLGYTMEQLYDKPLDELFEDLIFSKYNMKNSTGLLSTVEGTLVIGRDAIGKKRVSNWDFGAIAGAGSILSNVNDMMNFMSAQLTDNEILALTRKHTFTVNEKLSLGLGWHIITATDGRHIYWHNGGTGGYTSSIVLDKDNDNGVVILSNVSAFSKHMANVDALAFDIVKELVE